MEWTIGLIGFGEAGSTFANAAQWGARAHVFDRKTENANERAAMLARYADASVSGEGSLAAALAPATIILSLVTADQALAVAEAVAERLNPGVLFCDLNSVAPDTKRAAARTIEARGGLYADVAVMSPVNPARMDAPLLVSGPHTDRALEALAAIGFTKVRPAGDSVGRASSIKMIRSVMVKGIEALTAECVLAAEAAGVREDVLASLDASEKSRPWGERADYNLDRMMIHGLRRAAEMEEVVKTLDALGTGSPMTRGTVERQRVIGSLGLAEPADTLAGKIADISKTQNEKNGVKAA